MVSFKFEFDKPDRKYTGGETVQCKLIINVSSKFKARSLSLRFRGFAHTEWSVSKNNKRTGDEEYFRSYQYLFGNEHSSEQTVPEGTHTYNAAVKLPNNCPSNIEHSNGHIRYTVKAKYDVAWALDYTETVSFFVRPKIDLNDFVNLRNPIRKAEEKIFGCCFKSDPMQLINILPRGVYAVGETIPITIEVDNNSDVRIDFIRVRLKEKITFTANEPRVDTRTVTNTVNTHFFRTAVAAFQKKQFETTFYLDPSNDYKLFSGCGIIKCEYYIKSEGESAGCNSNPENSTIIIIGTIPFTDVVTNGNNNSITPTILAPSAPPIGFNPVLPTNGVIVEQPLPSYNDISVAGPSSSGVGWNKGLRSPSGAPIASTEKIYLDDGLPPPSFEDSRKSTFAIPGTARPVEATPSAPTEPTASATAPPE